MRSEADDGARSTDARRHHAGALEGVSEPLGRRGPHPAQCVRDDEAVVETESRVGVEGPATEALLETEQDILEVPVTLVDLVEPDPAVEVRDERGLVVVTRAPERGDGDPRGVLDLHGVPAEGVADRLDRGADGDQRAVGGQDDDALGACFVSCPQNGLDRLIGVEQSDDVVGDKGEAVAPGRGAEGGTVLLADDPVLAEQRDAGDRLGREVAGEEHCLVRKSAVLQREGVGAGPVEGGTEADGRHARAVDLVDESQVGLGDHGSDDGEAVLVVDELSPGVDDDGAGTPHRSLDLADDELDRAVDVAALLRLGEGEPDAVVEVLDEVGAPGELHADAHLVGSAGAPCQQLLRSFFFRRHAEVSIPVATADYRLPYLSTDLVTWIGQRVMPMRAKPKHSMALPRSSAQVSCSVSRAAVTIFSAVSREWGNVESECG